jgi:hypothetical protein
MILIEDELLTHQKCNEIIELCHNANGTFSVLNNRLYKDLFHINREMSLKMGVFYTSYLATKGQQLYPELIQAMVWQEGVSQSFHVDDKRSSTTLTSITYLNDDFEGGETIFENGLTIRPKKGKTVFFDGQKYRHGVSCVSKGIRFVLANWYSKDIENLYI